ncbi:MAG: metallopeptidase family protein [Archangium sp.]|nr:metallopeptidase family protein [Archangium sp.]
MSAVMSASVEQLLQMADDALRDGEFEDTIALSKQALEQEPNNTDALELQGMALGELGEPEADVVFERLLKLAPKSTTALLGAARVKIVLAGDDRDRIADGLELLERAEPVAKRDEELSIELESLRGVAFNKLGDNEDALDSFARVLQLDPTHPEARIEQAVAFFELARFDDAKKAFERIVRDDPQEAWAHHHLGLLAERRGEDPEPYFARARKLAPDEFFAPVVLSDDEFRAAVEKAIDELPEESREAVAEVPILIEPIPSDDDLADGLSPIILGIFMGAPINDRPMGLDSITPNAMSFEAPRIKLFKKNLERFARTREEIFEEIKITVHHEVGHLLGMDEDELYDRGLD